MTYFGMTDLDIDDQLRCDAFYQSDAFCKSDTFYQGDAFCKSDAFYQSDVFYQGNTFCRLRLLP